MSSGGECGVDQCATRRHGGSRWCSKHEYRLRKFGSSELPVTEPSHCSVAGCEGTYQARGFCRTHYARLQRTGTSDPRPRVEDIFWSRVQVGEPDECWAWLGPVNNAGYGRIGKRYAHRISCERAHGPAPTANSVALHVCDNPPCVNPDHVSWGTQSQNVADSYRRARR